MPKKEKPPPPTIDLGGLLASARKRFEAFQDPRAKNVVYTLPDILMSGLAMFQLKYPSLHAFEQQTAAERHNLRTVFGIGGLCTDAQLRNVLDLVPPQSLRPLFSSYFEQLRAVGVVEEYAVYKDSVVVALDGVEYFRSELIHCDHCQVRKHREGQLSYSHSAVCAVLVGPGKREVFPIDMEEISKQDGSIKNDCERNATGRLLPRLKEQYPKQSMILTGDALYSNAPCVRQIQQNGWHFVLNIKPDSHATLFEAFEHRKRQKTVKRFTLTDNKGQHSFEWTNNLPLCESAGDIRVNMLRYEWTDKKGVKTTFTWATDLLLSQNNVQTIAQIGRSRWKIENETFNTLKNQGYNFEHNYGHGYRHLVAVLALLMFLAFLFDQMVQHCSHAFKSIWEVAKTKIKIWECQRALFSTQYFRDFKELFAALAALFEVKLE